MLAHLVIRTFKLMHLYTALSVQLQLIIKHIPLSLKNANENLALYWRLDWISHFSECLLRFVHRNQANLKI